MSKFFHFSQNNSGGSFVFDAMAGITHHVVVEADSAEHANDRAEQIGLYFNGCDDGMDCECCGDRWHPQWRGDAGDESPRVYGKDALTYGREWMDGSEVFVHYLDGRVVGSE